MNLWSRRWPYRIIGWSRVLTGNVRDPLVGRDLLMGGLFAIGSLLLIPLALKWSGLAMIVPRLAEVVTLQGLRGLVGHSLSSLSLQVGGALGFLFVLTLLSVLLRREWLAFGVALIIWTITRGAPPVFEAWLMVGMWVMFQLVVVARFGLLALVAYNVCFIMIRDYPITSDFTAWYAGGTLFALGVIVAICGYGFYTSLGGQKVFAGKLLEE